MDDLELPVFPLEEMVFFPRVLLPLHIFESRYRKMIEDLQAKPKEERLLVIANMHNKSRPKGKNPFQPVGTIGKLVHVEKMEDGRSNIVIYGQLTCEIEEITPSPKPYRMVKIREIREEYWANPLEDRTDKKIKMATAIDDFAKRAKIKIENVSDISLDDLINGLIFSLSLQPRQKQKLLEEPNLDTRFSKLLTTLDNIGYYQDYIPDDDLYTDIN